MVSCHIEPAITCKAGNDSIVCGSILIYSGDHQRSLSCRLKKPEQALKRRNDPDINKE